MSPIMEGNYAAAYGAKLCRPGVIAAYPITPQTTIAEKLSEFVAKGELDAAFVPVESEHSAISVCVAAQATGVRTFTATSSHGLAYMHELLHWAAGARLPIVMVNVNRALAVPWNIKPDQQDSISQRDTGWMQIHCENGQEVLDSVIIAYRVAEEAMLPAMVCMEGFVVSHVSEAVEIPPQEAVDRFLPPYEPEIYLDVSQPFAFCPSAPQDYMGLRYFVQQAMEKAASFFPEAEDEFTGLFGRKYSAVAPYLMEDADTVMVAAGAISATLRHTARALRKRGERVGVLRVRWFRPFPDSEVRKHLCGRKAVVVFDRSISYGKGGALACEIRDALYGAKDAPPVYSVIAGLGGADVTPEMIEDAIRNAERVGIEGKAQWIGMKR